MPPVPGANYFPFSISSTDPNLTEVERNRGTGGVGAQEEPHTAGISHQIIFRAITIITIVLKIVGRVSGHVNQASGLIFSSVYNNGWVITIFVLVAKVAILNQVEFRSYQM